MRWWAVPISAAAASWSVAFERSEYDVASGVFNPLLSSSATADEADRLEAVRLCARVDDARAPAAACAAIADPSRPSVDVDVSRYRGREVAVSGWVERDGVVLARASARVRVAATVGGTVCGGGGFAPPPPPPLAAAVDRGGPCAPLATAFDGRPDFEARSRFLWAPHGRCGPRPVFWFTNAGDTFWESYGWRECTNLFRWLARFYDAAAPRVAGARHLVLDVGASIGQEAIIAATYGHDVLAFEPFAETAETARANAELNCVADRVTVVAAGADAAPGRSCSGYAFGSADRSYADAGISADGGVSGDGCLELTTLDVELDARNETRRPLVLKIDVNGVEAAVLDGSVRLLAQRPPYVLIFEWLALARQNHRFDDVVSSLNAFGYRLYPLTDIDASFGYDDPAPHWHDVFADPIPRGCDGRPIAEMTRFAVDVDVVAIHRDLPLLGRLY